MSCQDIVKQYSMLPLMQDLKFMTLPKTVSRILSEEDKNLKKVIQHISTEKRKIDQDIDECIQEIIKVFNQTRQRLHQNFDQFFTQFKQNYQVLKQKCNQFKEQSKQTACVNEHPSMVELQKISFFTSDASDPAKLVKVKEENCQMKASTQNIQREI